MPALRIRRSKYWLANNMVICTTPRVASTSMCFALDSERSHNDSKSISTDRAIELKEEGLDVILWHRDPLERLASSYHLFGRKSPEEFVDQVLSNVNIHWTPQIDIHTYDGVFLPTVTYKFEDLKETWNKELPDYSMYDFRRTPDRIKWPELSTLISSDKLILIEKKFEADINFH